MKIIKYFGKMILFVAIAGATCLGVFIALKTFTDTNQGNKPSIRNADSKATATPTVSSTPKAPSEFDAGTKLKETDRSNAVMVDGVTVSEIADTVLPSIVQIRATFTGRDFYGRIVTETQSGSGILIERDETFLYVATNNHVVGNAESVTVIFHDNTEVSFTVRGTDVAGDLAIITAPVSDIPKELLESLRIAKLGTDSNPKVGDMVIALGNALGEGTSLTVGYISAVDREVQTEAGPMLLIQTDAAINPGNSGGALVNIRGEVIGINSSKYTQDAVEGMGFAIPITQAFPILNSLKTGEVVSADEAGYLGVYIQSVDDDMIRDFGWPRGIYVKSLVADGSAAQAGILPGDIITAVNGIHVLDTSQLIARVTSFRAGTEITLSVTRYNGTEKQELEIVVTLMNKAVLPNS